ncbi:allantoate permease [Dipodascopsis uninucleata]
MDVFDEEYGFSERSAEWHVRERRKLVKKMDKKLLSLVALMYLLNYLDRSNLSQARLGGLENDLHMTGRNFNLLTAIVFVGYNLMQLPSNMILVRVRPSIYLGVCMGIWGFFSTIHGFTTNFRQILFCRFFLGAIEAPFFPGVLALLSSWYTKKELAHRFAIFYGGSQAGCMLGGLIAAGVLANFDGFLGIAGWRWLFIVEGSATILVSIVAIRILPDYPGNTRWLSDKEQKYAQWCLSNDVGIADDNNAVSVREAFMMVVTDYKIYIFAIMMHANALAQTFSFFFPTIVETLGFGPITTLLLTVPVWFVAFLFSLSYSYHASKTNERAFHIMFAMLICFLGNVITISTTQPALRYFAMFLMPMGAYPGIQIMIAWLVSAIPRPSAKRTIALGFCNTLANVSNIYGSYLYPASAGPRYFAAGAVVSIMCLICIVCSATMRAILLNEASYSHIAAVHSEVATGLDDDADSVSKTLIPKVVGRPVV